MSQTQTTTAKNVFDFVNIHTLRAERVGALRVQCGCGRKVSPFQARIHIRDIESVFDDKMFSGQNDLPFLCDTCSAEFTALADKQRKMSKADLAKEAVVLAGFLRSFSSPKSATVPGILQMLQVDEEVRKRVRALIADKDALMSATTLAEVPLAELQMSIPHRAGDAWLANASKYDRVSDVFGSYVDLMVAKKRNELDFIGAKSLVEYSAFEDEMRQMVRTLRGQDWTGGKINRPFFNGSEPTAIEVRSGQFVVVSGRYAEIVAQEVFKADDEQRFCNYVNCLWQAVKPLMDTRHFLAQKAEKRRVAQEEANEQFTPDLSRLGKKRGPSAPRADKDNRGGRRYTL